MLYVFGALIAGLIIPLQTGVNTKLTKWLGSPFYASFVSFIFATATMVLLLFVTGAFGDGVALTSLPAWLWLGGVFGTLVITGNILLLPRLGGVQSVVLPAAGQTMMGLAIDTWGLFGSPDEGFAITRLLGAGIVILGIALTTLSREEQDRETHKKEPCGIWLWRLFGISLGASTACQTAVNGCFGSVLGSSIEAALLSCAVGMVLLGLISLVLALAKRDKSREKTVRGTWWMWTGGALGGTMILLNATLAPLMGTGSEVIFALTGSILFGALIDQFGLFGVEKKPLTGLRALGLVVLLAGACMVRFC